MHCLCAYSENTFNLRCTPIRAGKSKALGKERSNPKCELVVDCKSGFARRVRRFNCRLQDEMLRNQLKEHAKGAPIIGAPFELVLIEAELHVYQPGYQALAPWQ